MRSRLGFAPPTDSRPESRERRLPGLNLLCGLLCGALLALSAGAGPVAAASENQVWVFMHIVDKTVENQKVSMQFPIECLRDLGTLRILDVDPDTIVQVIDGPLIYRNYKELEVGREEKVLTFRTADADVGLSVVSRARQKGAGTSSLHIDHINRFKPQDDVELTLPLTSPETLAQTMLTAIEKWPRLKDRIEGIDRLRYCLPHLGKVPSYQVVKVEGADLRIVVKTQ